jgi:hypothetical protein
MQFSFAYSTGRGTFVHRRNAPLPAAPPRLSWLSAIQSAPAITIGLQAVRRLTAAHKAEQFKGRSSGA